MRSSLPTIIASLVVLLALAACVSPGAGATALPTAHATVIVITATGPYFTSFDDPGDWLIGDSENSAGRVENGEYVLSVKKPRLIAWANQPRIFGDGVYEVNARLVSGAEASGFGLLLMGASDLSAFFYVMITGDGRYDIGICLEGCSKEQSIIGGYKLAPVILTDNQANHIKIELDKGKLTLEVNGAPTSSVQGLVYSRGVIGLIGESAQYGGFEAAFDNLSVVESEPILPPATIVPEDVTPAVDSTGTP